MTGGRREPDIRSLDLIPRVPGSLSKRAGWRNVSYLQDGGWMKSRRVEAGRIMWIAEERGWEPTLGGGQGHKKETNKGWIGRWKEYIIRNDEACGSGTKDTRQGFLEKREDGGDWGERNGDERRHWRNRQKQERERTGNFHYCPSHHSQQHGFVFARKWRDTGEIKRWWKPRQIEIRKEEGEH